MDVLHGDCLDILPTLEADNFHCVATDPPYHLSEVPHVKRGGFGGDRGDERRASRSGFMGKQWDGGDVAFRPETWAEVYRVLKPGGHMLVFGGTRTVHRMACAIEDAGFEIKDTLMYLYGTGFPKHRNALKPAYEPILLCRKPLSEPSIAANVLKHGTGGLNIDDCRVGPPTDTRRSKGINPGKSSAFPHSDDNWVPHLASGGQCVAGRWPANVLHDGSNEVLAAFAAYGERGALAPVHRRGGDKFRGTYGKFVGNIDEAGSTFQGDTGTAARFFYSAKATKADRAGSSHPTVKPVKLMEYLVRLITPPGGRVLDPFAGSGTTGQACRNQGFDCTLIERELEYIADIQRRLTAQPILQECLL